MASIYYLISIETTFMLLKLNTYRTASTSEP